MANLLKQIFTKFNNFPMVNNLALSKNVCVPLVHNFQARYSSTATVHEIIDPNKDDLTTKDTIKQVNQQISESQQGRLFAVAQIAGKQFKITEGDVVIIEGYWPPDVGDKIRLEKILMVGAEDFTLIGRPLIQDDLVDVTATVIEKKLSHTKTNFKKIRRKQYQKIQFYRIPQSVLRINKIQIQGEVNNPPTVSDLGNRVM